MTKMLYSRTRGSLKFVTNPNYQSLTPLIQYVVAVIAQFARFSELGKIWALCLKTMISLIDAFMARHVVYDMSKVNNS